MYESGTPFGIKSLRWNLSESSRKVMGSRWCEGRAAMEFAQSLASLQPSIAAARRKTLELIERLRSIELQEQQRS